MIVIHKSPQPYNTSIATQNTSLITSEKNVQKFAKIKFSIRKKTFTFRKAPIMKEEAVTALRNLIRDNPETSLKQRLTLMKSHSILYPWSHLSTSWLSNLIIKKKLSSKPKLPRYKLTEDDVKNLQKLIDDNLGAGSFELISLMQNNHKLHALASMSSSTFLRLADKYKLRYIRKSTGGKLPSEAFEKALRSIDPSSNQKLILISPKNKHSYYAKTSHPFAYKGMDSLSLQKLIKKNPKLGADSLKKQFSSDTTLSKYSNISVTTLRRHIKNRGLDYKPKVEKGKYDNLDRKALTALVKSNPCAGCIKLKKLMEKDDLLHKWHTIPKTTLYNILKKLDIGYNPKRYVSKKTSDKRLPPKGKYADLDYAALIGLVKSNPGAGCRRLKKFMKKDAKLRKWHTIPKTSLRDILNKYDIGFKPSRKKMTPLKPYSKKKRLQICLQTKESLTSDINKNLPSSNNVPKANSEPFTNFNSAPINQKTSVSLSPMPSSAPNKMDLCSSQNYLPFNEFDFVL